MTEYYINWSKAPEGTTHCYLSNDYSATFTDGVPDRSCYWEKHTEEGVFEWGGSFWVYCHLLEMDMVFRSVRPTEPSQSPAPHSMQSHLDRAERSLRDAQKAVEALRELVYGD